MTDNTNIEGLPELPYPEGRVHTVAGSDDLFTADQVREYASMCVRAALSNAEPVGTNTLPPLPTPVSVRPANVGNRKRMDFYSPEQMKAYAIEAIQAVSKPREEMIAWRSRFMGWRGRQATDQEVWDAAIASATNTGEQG